MSSSNQPFDARRMMRLPTTALDDPRQFHMATIDEAMQLALAHQHGGRMREAEAAYREILARDPRHVEALNNLGNVLQDGGQLEAAIQCFERALALRPDAPPLHFNLANALRAGGFQLRALAGYRQAVALEPNFAAGYNNLALLQKEMGELDGAQRSLEEAVRVDPNYAEAHYNLGWVRQDRGDLSGAGESYRRSIELQPQNAAAHHSLGWVRQDRGDLSGAGESYRSAIELEPQNAVAHFNLGLVYQAQSDWERARRQFSEALRIRPQYAQPHCSLGVMHLAVGEDDQAFAHFERALEIDPQCPEAHYNRGVVLLSRGDYQAGWPEYAWRRRCSSHREPDFDRPAWDGSPLAGRTLLIRCNFGFGDTLQFARYVPEVRKRGAGRVLLAAQPALHPLLAESGLGPLVSPGARDLKYDCYISVMDLPCAFRSTDGTIPPGPYLRAAVPAVAKWAKTLAGLGGFQIGIAWQGDRNYVSDHLRSIPLAEFEPLARVPGVRLISLQKGDGVEQLPLVADRFDVTELPNTADRQFMDTAAIIANLDLVIAADTAVAHLAGAMGTPIWVALRLETEWRWPRGRDTTAWYPSMRLFRQTSGGDWASLFTQMAAKLHSMSLNRQTNR
jgi:tetratricopeptide (TPR) repeat protein